MSRDRDGGRAVPEVRLSTAFWSRGLRRTCALPSSAVQDGFGDLSTGGTDARSTTVLTCTEPVVSAGAGPEDFT